MSHEKRIGQAEMAQPSSDNPRKETLEALPGGQTLELTLNGERRHLTAPLSVYALLRGLGLDARKVAVERNLAIVPKSRYGDTQLENGDSLEIVHFIGGG